MVSGIRRYAFKRGTTICLVAALVVPMLGGCATKQAMPASRAITLQKMSKTIIYVTPRHSKIAYQSDLSDMSYSGAFFSGFLGGLAGVGLYSWGYENQKQLEFRDKLKPYSKELAALPVAAEEKNAATEALSGVSWLKGLKIHEAHPRNDSYFFHHETLRQKTEATLFVIPLGIRLADDAKYVYAYFAVRAYYKHGVEPRTARSLVSSTVEARQAITYPEAVKHFNVLTAPTATPLGWRLQLLFAHDARMLRSAIKVVMQKASWDLRAYFPDHS
jgi:hypothetical protein